MILNRLFFFHYQYLILILLLTYFYMPALNGFVCVIKGHLKVVNRISHSPLGLLTQSEL